MMHDIIYSVQIYSHCVYQDFSYVFQFLVPQVTKGMQQAVSGTQQLQVVKGKQQSPKAEGGEGHAT